MSNNYLQLDYIINTNNFQIIQDSIAKATDMAVVTVDFKGNPVTNHSRCSDFCNMVRSKPEYRQLCEKCDSRGGLEAARLQKPYIYICHMGLVDFAIPIIMEGNYIGAVMAGQVLVSNDVEKELEHIVHHTLPMLTSSESLEAYGQVPRLTFEKIRDVADMLFHVSNYIVEEALLKIKLNEQNNTSKATFLGREVNENNYGSGIELSRITETRLYRKPKQDKQNVILGPALDYIHSKYNEMITLEDMATLCNVSSSYFSKLFKKIVGENFANYINKVRIKKAKEFLEATDTPVMNIALDLGFDDCGYFIKVFKKLEGITPSNYRKLHNTTEMYD